MAPSLSLADLRDRREELLATAARRGASNVAILGAASRVTSLRMEP